MCFEFTFSAVFIHRLELLFVVGFKRALFKLGENIVHRKTDVREHNFKVINKVRDLADKLLSGACAEL